MRLAHGEVGLSRLAILARGHHGAEIVFDQVIKNISTAQWLAEDDGVSPRSASLLRGALRE